MTGAKLSLLAPLLFLCASGAVAQAQESSARQSCLASSDRETTVPAADSAPHWITDFSGLQQITNQTPARPIRLSFTDVVIGDVDPEGFWIRASNSSCRLYVRPAEGDLIHVRRGEVVSVQGEIRYEALRSTPNTKPRRQPYLYSYIVRPAWYPQAKATISAGH